MVAPGISAQVAVAKASNSKLASDEGFEEPLGLAEEEIETSIRSVVSTDRLSDSVERLDTDNGRQRGGRPSSAGLRLRGGVAGQG